MKTLGISNPEDAIGKKLQISNLSCRIVGVVKDFFNTSLKAEQSPVAFLYIPGYFMS